jgi:polysaccharide biosynthesis protein PslA
MSHRTWKQLTEAFVSQPFGSAVGTFSTFTSDRIQLGASSRPKQIGWLTISIALVLTDFSIVITAGPLSMTAVAGMSADFDGFAFSVFGVAPLLTVVTLYERGVYSRPAILHGTHLPQVILGWLYAFGLLLLAMAIWSTLRNPPAEADPFLAIFHKSWLAAFLIIGLCGLVATRLLWATLRDRVIAERLVEGRALIIGMEPIAGRVLQRLRKDPKSGIHLIGVVETGIDGECRQLEPLSGSPRVHHGAGGFASLIRQVGADTVIVALPWTARRQIARVLADAGRTPVNLYLAPDFEHSEYLRYPLRAVGSQPLLNVSSEPISGIRSVLKRFQDVTIAGSAVLVLAPLLLIIAAAIKIESQGPVLFKQRRHGFNGCLFQMLKFRSMHVSMADELCKQQTSRNDDRLTRLGAFLRRHSLDELPQLLNVLRGDMSIVGPRPHALSTKVEGLPLEEAVDAYIGRWRVKPGITGWAQVNGCRGELTEIEKLRRRVALDLEYIERWSLSMDLRILWLTLPRMFQDENAY